MENPNITLARILWAQFIDADTSNPERMRSKWNEQVEDRRRAWMRVAEFVSGMVQETIIIYGYNGKEPYEGLDTIINSPDHR